MTIADYAEFVKFKEPREAAEPLVAALNERVNLLRGSSGGYVSSGYYSINHIINGYHVAYQVRSKINAMLNVPGTDPKWISPSTLSGGTMTIMAPGEIYSSAGIPGFESSQPPFAGLNTVSMFVGLASAISLMAYDLDSVENEFFPMVKYSQMNELSSALDDSSWSPVYSSTTTMRGEFLYFRVYNDNTWSADMIRPISIVLLNSLTYVPHTFSAIYSGGVYVKERVGSNSSTYDMPLSTVEVSADVSGGGTATIPVSGYYTYNKTFAELKPSSPDSLLSMYYSSASVPWKGRGAWSYRVSGVLQSNNGYAYGRIGEAAIFFGGTQTVNNQ